MYRSRRQSSGSPGKAITTAAAYAAAVRMLGGREHSVIELRRKLKKRFGESSASVLEEALEQLIEDGLLSDQRFAESLVRGRAGRGYGPFYITQELRAKGINDELADACLQSYVDEEMAAVTDTDLVDALESGKSIWHQNARRLASRKFPDLATDPKQWQRARGYLTRRGFGGGEVGYAVGRMPEMRQE